MATGIHTVTGPRASVPWSFTRSPEMRGASRHDHWTSDHSTDLREKEQTPFHTQLITSEPARTEETPPHPPQNPQPSDTHGQATRRDSWPLPPPQSLEYLPPDREWLMAPLDRRSWEKDLREGTAQFHKLFLLVRSWRSSSRLQGAERSCSRFWDGENVHLLLELSPALSRCAKQVFLHQVYSHLQSIV